MKHSLFVVWLSWVIVLLALVAVAAGFFWPADGGSSFAFTTVRGDTVMIYGHGLYRYDTIFVGAANRGSDLVTLGLGIPLLTYATLRYWRGSLRGGLLLLGTLVYFLYLYSSYALGTAFNPLLPVYIALFSASLFAFVLLFGALAAQFSMEQLAADLPHRGVAMFMFASGLATLVIWLQPLLSELAHNQLPAMLGVYTTKVTDVLDLGIITPATFIAGRLIWRHKPSGYLMAFSLLVLEMMLTPMIVAQTVSQWQAGIRFTPAEMIGPIVGFATLGLFALWVMSILWRKTVETVKRSALPLQPLQI
ncbi:MAG: hypothetical protein R2867_44260 [Caldilineaceae bacterium]